MKARPDDFVILIANEFNVDALDYLRETHEEFWQEELIVEFEDAEHGSISLPEAQVSLVVDPAIPELHDFAGKALEPFGASDLAMLARHTHVWRLVASGPFAAWPLVRLASSTVEAGASAVFLPGTRQLHSPQAVQRLAMDPAPDALANFFVSAFDGEGWMRTRGLTPFGLPELETKIVDGHNAAYFRLMDVSAAMIENGRPFADGAQLSLGPKVHELSTGPVGPLTDEIPINGLHGIQTLR